MGHECSKGIFKISAIRYGIVTSKVYITILSPTNSKAEITRFAIWSWKLIINVLQITGDIIKGKSWRVFEKARYFGPTDRI